MNAIKVLLGRVLMSLGIMSVWAKLLAEGRADAQPETDKKTAGVHSKSPTVNPNEGGAITVLPRLGGSVDVVISVAAPTTASLVRFAKGSTLMLWHRLQAS
jgi:hypothetical protein